VIPTPRVCDETHSFAKYANEWGTLGYLGHPPDGFYEHDGATPSFFLQDQLQWTEQSQGELKSKLGANQ